jgi:UrcA family protein
MKKAIAAAIFALALLGSATSAAADPSARECHSVSITVNGDNLVNEAGCNVLPPQ